MDRENQADADRVKGNAPGENPFTRAAGIPGGVDRAPDDEPGEWSEPAFLNKQDAALRIGRHVSTLYRWEKDGEIEFYLKFVKTVDLLETDRRMRLRGGDQSKVESLGDWLTLKDAAARIGVGLSTLYRWIDQGALRRVGKRVQLADLLEVARQMKHRRGRPPARGD